MAIFIFFVLPIASCGNSTEKDVDDENKIQYKAINEQVLRGYAAVPSDAVAIFDFEKIEDYSHLISDTSNFAFGLLDPSSPLVRFQKLIVSKGDRAKKMHTLFSLRYSGKNDISLLQIIDFTPDSLALYSLMSQLNSIPFTSKSYNGATLKSYSDGLNLAVKNKLMIVSSSIINVETSLRHISSGSSILTNADFSSILNATGGTGIFYINHKQIGKIFSGSVTSPFLKYADFFARYGNWSALQINARQKNYFSLIGESLSSSDLINYSTTISYLSPGESMIDQFLPASTIFAVAVNLNGSKSYLKNYKRFLDANKRLNSYIANAEKVAIQGEKSPEEWFVNEDFDEVVSAICLVGGKYEWVHFTYKKSNNFFRKLTGIKGSSPKSKVEPYKYKGYLGAVLGESFTHAPEENICYLGEWSIIGSARSIAEFESGKVTKVNLQKYLSHTPASSFFSEKYSIRVWANIGEGKDTLLSVLNKYYRGRVTESLKHKNFEFATIGISSRGKKIITALNYYASSLSSPPKMFEESDLEDQFFVDSTIKVSYGPFTIFSRQKGDTLYFEQSKKYLSISLSNSQRKALWGIPMKDTIRGYADYVEWVDGKEYVTFAMSNKLYLINQKGAFANGYPKQIDKNIALGPKVIFENGEYRLLIIDSDNVIRKLTLSGEAVPGWTNIHADEFTHNLPEIMNLFGKEYYILRTVGRTRIYTPNGEEITKKNLKKPISKESPIEQMDNNYIKVMGVDGKEFLLNLSNGRIKRL